MAQRTERFLLIFKDPGSKPVIGVPNYCKLFIEMQENKKSPEALNFKNFFGPSCNLEVASSNQLGTTELEEYLLQRSVMTSSDIL